MQLKMNTKVRMSVFFMSLEMTYFHSFSKKNDQTKPLITLHFAWNLRSTGEKEFRIIMLRVEENLIAGSVFNDLSGIHHSYMIHQVSNYS